MIKFITAVQCISFIFACVCSLIFSILRETAIGYNYSNIFLDLCILWFVIFTIFICVEECSYEKEKLSENYENCEKSLV